MKKEDETPYLRRARAGYGYIIVTESGMMIHNTLRRNRHDCWTAFLRGAPKTAKVKREYKCIPVWLREHLPSSALADRVT